MNTIEINRDPAMCRYLAQDTDLFQKDPIIIVDVGARDGFNAEWSVFGAGMRVFCFEPDKEECERLNKAAPPHVTYIPVALGRERQGQTLFEARLSYSTGLYPSNMVFFSRLLNRDNAEVIGQHPIWVETLNQVMAERKINAINFMKLDAEGAELDILMGATNLLKSPTLFGIATEIRFHPEINGSPPFWQMDQYLQAQGFRLFDISANRQTRAVLPYPGIMDYLLPDGRRFYAYTVHGQIMDGDALYFRDVLTPKNQEIRGTFKELDFLKLAAFYELYHHNDAAAEVIVNYRGQIQPLVDCDLLLTLLTPPLKGEKLSYSEYMAKYFDLKTSFAPSLEAPPPPQGGDAGDAGSSVDMKYYHRALAELAALSNTRREAALREELRQVYASTSWQITKPLREIKARLRRALAKSAALSNTAVLKEALRRAYDSTLWRITKLVRAIKAHLSGK